MNYIYFGAYFLLLALMSASGIFVKDPLSESKFFFFFYATAQIALETFLLIFFGFLIQRFTNRMLFLAFIGATFLLFVLRVLDCLMDRILDLSIWGTFSSFVLNETFSNFLYLLDASGIPNWAWIILFSILITLPILGIAIYKNTERVTKKYPLNFSFESCCVSVFSLSAALFFWDFSASRVIHPNTYTAFAQSLPWKRTLLQPENVIIQTENHLAPLLQEKELIASLAKHQKTPLKAKPNIFLFIIESFREDFITPDVAPNLYAFKESSVPIHTTLSNANASHLSWFSIFHSQFSLYWYLLQQNHWNMGSPPLHLLKNLGYQIRLYSSAELGYYGMEELLFGKNCHLLDSYQKFPHPAPIPAADTDANALAAMTQDMIQNPSFNEGQIFLIFWDSTHFDYSWPKTWTPKFTPFANDLAYFKSFYSQKRINLIKNRYRNSVHYVDHLFGKFLQTIPNKEEAIIIVTGDHGEEFFEHGHLFHGSHLVQEQTRVPIFMKFGTKENLQGKRALATQMDIFPSIIDALSEDIPSFLQGQSVLKETKHPFALISRFNAGRTPFEFCLHNGKNKCIARFGERSDILHSKTLQIMSLKSFDDKTIPDSHKDVHSWVNQEFGPAIHHLFHN